MDDRKSTPAPPGGAAAPEARRITAVAIQQKEFRLGFRGYNEREVDQFLDEVTEEVARLHAENKRLREEIELRGTARLDTGTVTQADEILRRAREQAARIVAEAEAGAAAARHAGGREPGGSAEVGEASSPSRAFLLRERDFLQSLASLIQGHAAVVRDELRSARGGSGSHDAGPVAETASRSEAGEPLPAGPVAEDGVPQKQPPDSGPPTQAWTPRFTEGREGESAPQGHPVEGADEEPAEGGPSSWERTGDAEGGGGSGGGGGSEATPWWAEGRVTDAVANDSGDSGGSPQAAGGTTPVAVTDQPASSTRIWVQDEAEPVVVPAVEALPAEDPAEPATDGQGEDRSLRELFWGED